MSTVIKAIAAIFFLSGAILDYYVLATPYATGVSGFFPTSIIFLFAWVLSVAMALLYLEALLTLPEGSNLFSMTESYFGKNFKRGLAVLYSLFFSYPLLASFFSFIFILYRDDYSSLIGFQLSKNLLYLLVFLFYALLLYLRLSVALFVNFLLTIGIFVTNFLVLKNGAPFVQSQNLLINNWSYIIASLPLFFFFRFQTTLPILISLLQRRYKLLILVVTLGILLPHLSLIGYNWLISGSISQEDLMGVFDFPQPLFKALFLIDSAPWFGQSVLLFGLFAVSNCFLVNGYATVEIFADGFKLQPSERRGIKRLLVILLVLVPPAIFSLCFSEIAGVIGMLAIDFIDLLLSLLVIATVWIIRYRLSLATPRLLFGGKTLLVLLYCFIFYFLWLHGISLLR